MLNQVFAIFSGLGDFGGFLFFLCFCAGFLEADLEADWPEFVKTLRKAQKSSRSISKTADLKSELTFLAINCLPSSAGPAFFFPML
ncbi:MAG: hypothetical protein JW715_00835 [Sedimentisphaerales bacterium]|nr:hypothetical protein [Sedimentisphaerales bacterium]